MGSRGNFANVDLKDFTFKENGKTFKSIGDIGNIKVLVRPNYSVKAPEYSHSASRVYAIVQNGVLKHIAYYDDNHKQTAVVDLAHWHKGLKPHRHLFLDHNDNGIKITEKDKEIIAKVKKEFNLK